MPYAEDIRNYTFPSLDDLKNRKGEAVSKHPHITTDAMVDAMEKWVDDMDLMEAEEEADGYVREGLPCSRIVDVSPPKQHHSSVV